jgi:formate hydrogenlyase subunit 3/multisubunit Na+/H+ antiporter MnhD subunit
MNPTLLMKALILLVPAAALFSATAWKFRRRRGWAEFLQSLGAACIVVVALTHVCEGLHWFNDMNWGQPHSAGHYLDLCSALLGLTLFPAGYLLAAASRRRLSTPKR